MGRFPSTRNQQQDTGSLGTAQISEFLLQCI